LKGELAYQQQEYSNAISAWRSSTVEQSSLSELVVDKIIDSYKAIEDRKGLMKYLSEGAKIPKRNKVFIKWSETLIELFGKEEAIKRIIEQVGAEGLSGPVANFLNELEENKYLDAQNQGVLLIDLLKRANSKKNEYSCIGCGFDTKSIYWHCPNCGAWESFA